MLIIVFYNPRQPYILMGKNTCFTLLDIKYVCSAIPKFIHHITSKYFSVNKCDLINIRNNIIQ